MDVRRTEPPRSGRYGLRRAVAGALAACLAALALPGLPGAPPPARPGADPAAELRARRIELQPQLRRSPFGEPLVLVAREPPGRLEGDVYAEVPHPFDAVRAVFRTRTSLCELLFLHLNVRGCRPDGDDGVGLVVGPKRAAGPGLHRHMSYAVRTEAAGDAHLRVTLTADRGPLGTHDYRMVFEAVPLDAGRSFVHFGYGYGYGALSQALMSAYLATAGRDKIGFSIEGRDAGGAPGFVRGERAAVERNVMRHYLALRAHLGTPDGARDERMQARLRAWFLLTERYAPQLHEYDLDEYLREKNDDLARGALAD